MRFIYTLLLSFTVYIGCGQSNSSDSVIITGNCYGRRIPDTTADKLTQGLSGRFICLSAPVSYSNQQIITVHDAETLQSLPGATVSFISKNGIDSIRQPTLFVGGVLRKLDTLDLINPKEIRNITVINPKYATILYGPAGKNGIIFIHLKRYFKRHFIILDNNESLPNATLQFISVSNGQVFSLIADGHGRVSTDTLKVGERYRLTVSCVGYQTRELDYFNQDNDSESSLFISMNKEIKQCSPVVLFSTICYRKIRCGGMVRVTRDKAMPEPLAAKSISLHIYPNPAKRGGAITLQWDDASLRPAEYRVYSLNGMLVTRQPVNDKGANGQVRVNTDSRWAAGTYFLQAVCENGRVLASGKIIIQ